MTQHKQKYFFSADSHFGHANIRDYCGRDFETVHDMNVELTRAWNDTVGQNDTIFFLGDLCMNQKKIPEHLQRLNGKKFYIQGNHDRKAEQIVRKWEQHTGVKLVEEFSPLVTKVIQDHVIIMCHYAMRVWDRSHYDSIQLYAHSHSSLPPEGRQLDVGVDNAFRLLGEYRPFSLEEVLKFLPLKRVRARRKDED